MILITRSDETNHVLVTLDGRNYNNVMSIRNDATRKTADVELGEDTSLYPERYNLFEVASALFEGLPDGYYTYRITETGSQDTIESGKLYITPDADTQIPSAATPDNDILILN